MILQINKNRLIESFSTKKEDFNEISEKLVDCMFLCKSFPEFKSKYPKSYKFYRKYYADSISIEKDMSFEDITYEVLVEMTLNRDDEEYYDG